MTMGGFAGAVLLVLLAGVFLAAAGSVESATGAPEWRWDHAPFHAAIKAAGGLLALALGGILLTLRKHESDTRHHSWRFAALEQGTNRFEWPDRRTDGAPSTAEVALDALNMSGNTVLRAVVREIAERGRVEEKRQNNMQEAKKSNRPAVGRKLGAIELKREVSELSDSRECEWKYGVPGLEHVS